MLIRHSKVCIREAHGILRVSLDPGFGRGYEKPNGLFIGRKCVPWGAIDTVQVDWRTTDCIFLLGVSLSVTIRKL